MRRLAPFLSGALLVAASLPLSGCGQVTTSTSVEKRNARTLELVPEDKARSIRPRLTAQYDSTRGVIVMNAAKEIAGQLHAFEAYDQATITVKSKQPEIVSYAIANVFLFGLPLALAVVDDKAREDAKTSLTGREISRGEKVAYRVDQAGVSTGRDGVTVTAWHGASVAYALEDGQAATALTDSAGTLEVRTVSLVDEAALLLDRDSLAFRAKLTLGSETSEQSLYLGPRDVASMREHVSQAAREEARLALRANDLRRAAARMNVAASLGDDIAQFELARLYREGRGVPQNRAEMMKWLGRAAKQGHVEAQLELASALADGADRSYPDAYFWSLLAASQGGDEIGRRSVAKRDELARRLASRDIEQTQSRAIAFKPVPELARGRPSGDGSSTVFDNVAALDPQARKGRAKPDAVALIIGIEDYSRLPPAQFAARDARSFRDFAINAMGIPAGRVRLLVDGEARGLDVQKALDNWLSPLVRDGATDVYVFFSGHGLASEDGRSLYLFPQDGDRALLAKSAIDRRAVIDTVLKAGAQSLTLFLDTCYSGGTRGDETLIADARPALLVTKDGEVPAPAALLAAAQGDQLSSSFPAARHGLFSYYVMRGLMGDADADGDHALTLGELNGFLQTNIRREASRRGRQQNPVLVGDGDRVVARW